MNFTELRAQLACTGRANEMCVDGSTPHQRTQLERHALTICAGCQHLDRCRTWVLRQPDDPSPVMVIGGMTPRQRRKTRQKQSVPRQQPEAPCETISAYQRHRRRGEECARCSAAWSRYSENYHQRRKAQKNDRGPA